MSSDDVEPPKGPQNLTPNGEVVKQIIKKGEGFLKPENGSDVTVHYVGTLEDGTKFDSSRDSGSPFEFQLGMGKVIKGWDVAIPTMLKGEISTITIAPSYAYGDTGMPPSIPPHATLKFEIELLSFRNEKDLTHDGGVLKKVIDESKEWQTPSYETKCQVELVGKLSDGTIFEDRKAEITIGDDQVCIGLEKALESMKRGEKSLVTIRSDYGYGDEGNSDLKIPPKATLYYTVHLIDFVKEKESFEMDSFEEKYITALKKKEEGNALFKQNKLKRAIAKYEKAIDYFEYEQGYDDDQKHKSNEIKLSCYTNLAIAYSKSGNYKKAMDSCNKVLERNNKSVKALYYRAIAYSNTDQWDLSKLDFLKALEIDKNNQEVKREFAKLKQKIKLQDEKDKKSYQKMFG
eukprot:TRINITY_DN412_c0_g5_i1.p1 TRINITY_DN412_c0_g5~~TRINITY_DN412_c0_g5_i1.p1  ORF type:complete len:417 (-),score=103.28 TRINITY_DN412_c0_g5_i1:68-1276(-)